MDFRNFLDPIWGFILKRVPTIRDPWISWLPCGNKNHEMRGHPVYVIIDYIHYISVTMGALSGREPSAKVIIILACVCVLVISSIICITIIVIFSGRNPTIVPKTTTEKIITEGTILIYILFTYCMVCLWWSSLEPVTVGFLKKDKTVVFPALKLSYSLVVVTSSGI